jgi:hypothetical protein
MDNSDEKSFVKHVFNFDDDSKSDMMNIVQYALIAIIPIVMLNKTMQKYVPEADEQKGSLEISAEIVVQVIGMFIGLLFIHRIITFIPTYSGTKYAEFNIVFVILAVLMITMSLQTKLGEKVSILVDRLMELWEGKPAKKGKGKVTVSQPIVQNGQMMGNGSAQQAMNQAMYSDGTSLNNLPTSMPTKQELPNYDTMHRPDTTPLVGASTPGMGGMGMGGMGIEQFEPMAANDALGGAFGGFSSW